MMNEIDNCRICKGSNRDLIYVLDLGEQILASIFPKNKEDKVLSAPLELVKCTGECGLLQLNHTLDRDLMYGETYGYRSGINRTMTLHLKSIAEYAMRVVSLRENDTIVDIGSNDGTLLGSYPEKYSRIGIDPSGKKFREFYPNGVVLIEKYFDKDVLKNIKAKIITSVAMFYDLQDPIHFMKDIKDCLAEDGIWISEQGYMPSILKNNSFDTICHEHLEYYGMKQIKWMADKVGLDVIDVSLNESNGGSFRVTFSHLNSPFKKNYQSVEKLLFEEEELESIETFLEFKGRVQRLRRELIKTIYAIKDKGKTIFGYGASTKGNVILQFCNLTENEITFIADRNPEKHGSFTPTGIPIISEDEARKLKPDYFFVLPWHFKKEILEREREYLNNGGKFIFPIPEIEIIGG